MKRSLLLIVGLLALLTARADGGGMWMPNMISDRIEDMRSKGFRLTAEEIYSEDAPSMKDAVAIFGVGCTGEMISPDGLMLTNHHCGFSELQKHSSVQNDYLKNGFWAMNRNEELPNPGLKASFLIRMEDITDRVLKGTDKLKDGKRDKAIEFNIASIKAAAVKGTHYNAEVKPVYYGNGYMLYVYETFEDVRIVGAPPSSIGKFGGETDNWMWPRHTGDFMFFRIYAGQDNKPAAYSPDNVPYKPRKYFSISTEGVEDGDFTMVCGFPARSSQFLCSAAVDQVLNLSNPAKIKLRTARLEVIQAARAADPAVRIAYAYKEANIANAWKKWQGESLGLERLGTVGKRVAYEERFEIWARQYAPSYRGVTAKLNNGYAAMKDHLIAADYYNEAVLGIELMKAARIIVSTKEDDDAVRKTFADFMKDYNRDIDRQIAKKLLAYYIDDVDREFIPEELLREIDTDGSIDAYVDRLFGETKLTNCFPTEGEDVRIIFNNDPALRLFGWFSDIYEDRIRPVVDRGNADIQSLYKTYLAGQIEFGKQQPSGRDFFPDANQTLRVAYGNIGGYSPSDAVVYQPVSTLRGILEKDNPEIYDYDIPDEMRGILASGDYGRWEVGGTVRVCFLASNQTSGGNSGSPVLNGEGKLIGVNFDRTWLSTMSDIEFDPEFCRNISVDIRYVLFVTEKVCGAVHLLEEMSIE